MKISGLRTFVVGNPPPSHGGRYFVFLTLTTDDGIVGVGEVYAATFHPSVVQRMVEDVFERHIEGADPFHVERLWHRVYARGYTSRPDVSLVGVLSGIELACWDIVGKAVGKPVYELLGGRVHERLRTYTYLYTEPGDAVDVYTDPGLAAERAAAYADRGFTALKFDPLAPYSAFDPRQPGLEALARAEEYVGKVRDAVGDRCDLLVGTHGQFTASGAVRLARRLERFDPLWLEEPVPPDSPEEMAKVARATSIPIATGERLTTKAEFARVLATGEGVFELTGYREEDLMGRNLVEALALSDREPVETVREWGVRKLEQKLTLRTNAGLEKPVLADLFPAYDEDGGLLVALTPR